ncbi:MAG: putative glycosyltransferase [Candidatus Saccharibacteria bacterium]|nr:putative glycosyltransferase [Candidatus Saccharibacteria bacterium]
MIDKMLTLTLVIPVYNEQDHIKACLDAIAAQYEAPLEVLVVDNNSTDNSVAIAKTFPFVTVLHAHEQGIAYARNVGFNAARGDIIGRIDADSRIPRHWVRHVRSYIEKYPNHLLTGGSYFYDLKLPKFFGWIQGQIAFRTNRFIMGYYIAWGSNMAFNKKLWDDVKNEVHNLPTIHEDMDLAIHLHEHGYKITYQAGLKVGVDSRLLSAKRDTRAKHMIYLKMWPRTLYLHKLKRAWLGWVGVYVVYGGYYFVFFLNFVSGLFGGKSSN